MASISQCYASWRLDQVRQCAKLRVGLVALVLHALSLSAMAQSPRADSPEVRVARTEQGVMLSGSVRFDLSSSIEDALLKGVPVHFVYEADVVRERWYWLDRRVSARSRHLRLSHQLLTRKNGAWRPRLRRVGSRAHRRTSNRPSTTLPMRLLPSNASTGGRSRNCRNWKAIRPTLFTSASASISPNFPDRCKLVSRVNRSGASIRREVFR